MRDQSRRDFLACMAGMTVAPAWLAGCGGSGAPAPVAAEPPPGPVNLDEVENAALARPNVPAAEPTIRVRVFRARQAGSSARQRPAEPIRVGEPGQWVRVTPDDPGSHPAAAQGPLAVSRDDAGWSLVDGAGLRLAAPPDASIDLESIDDADGLLTLREGQATSAKSEAPPRRYAGVLRCFARPDLAPEEPAAFDVINHLPMERYLPGVLAGELYRHWHPETFAAQCIAARSFAATEAAVFANRRHYDVSNTASSQMYLGTVLHQKSVDAAQATRGVMLAWEGLLVSGYYSSCCGGMAASASDAIGSNAVNDAGPLQGRVGSDVCDSAPVFQWKAAQPLDQFSRRLQGFAAERRHTALAQLGRLVAIEPCAMNFNGRPTRMRLMDVADGVVELPAERFRQAANWSGSSIAAPGKPLLSSNCRVWISPQTVSFEGYGFGHGVGLCQHGAQVHAKTGMMHREIVSWYYPGVEIVQGYA